MIGLGRRVQVLALAEPLDMRESFDTLGALVREQIQRDVLDGALFLLVGKGHRRAKVLFWDGTGLCVLAKRLEKGRFSAPRDHNKKAPVLEWTTSELALFLEGSELVGRVALSPPACRPTSAASRSPDATFRLSRISRDRARCARDPARP